MFVGQHNLTDQEFRIRRCEDDEEQRRAILDAFRERTGCFVRDELDFDMFVTILDHNGINKRRLSELQPGPLRSPRLLMYYPNGKIDKKTYDLLRDHPAVSQEVPDDNAWEGDPRRYENMGYGDYYRQLTIPEALEEPGFGTYLTSIANRALLSGIPPDRFRPTLRCMQFLH